MMRFATRTRRATGSQVREILKLTQQPDMISFAGGLPAERAMPPLDLGAVPASLRQYGLSEGELDLRETISQRLAALGRPCPPERILITSGSQQGLDLVAKLFVEGGTNIAVEAPTYLAALQAMGIYGANFCSVPLTAQGIELNQFAEMLKRDQPALAYLIPTFQNPTGCCYDIETRKTVASLLTEAGVPLIEDEPYRDLAYDTVDRQPICSFMGDAPWVYLGSFSKIGLPGLRVGFVAASEHLFEHLLHFKQATDLHSNRIGQWWVTKALTSGLLEENLQQLIPYYRQQRDVMEAQLHGHDMAALASWEKPAGGLFFWLTLNQSIDTNALLQRTLARNVAFMPGTPFYAADVDGPATMRVNFSHANEAQIEQGIGVIADEIRAML